MSYIRSLATMRDGMRFHNEVYRNAEVRNYWGPDTYSAYVPRGPIVLTRVQWAGSLDTDATSGNATLTLTVYKDWNASGNEVLQLFQDISAGVTPISASDWFQDKSTTIVNDGKQFVDTNEGFTMQVTGGAAGVQITDLNVEVMWDYENP